jgi:uncharacterized membrane protein
MSEPTRTRLVFLGFGEEDVARTVLDVIQSGIRTKAITVEDWAMVHKAQGGKVTITKDKDIDPGAGRGALFGGGAGAVLAALSGPIGIGAVATGAAIGAITAGIRDSGFKTEDVQEVSTLMADDRTGIVVGFPLAEAERWEAFVASRPEFAAADRTHQVDIVPGRTFEQALAEYRRDEEP